MPPSSQLSGQQNDVVDHLPSAHDILRAALVNDSPLHPDNVDPARASTLSPVHASEAAQSNNLTGNDVDGPEATTVRPRSRVAMRPSSALIDNEAVEASGDSESSTEGEQGDSSSDEDDDSADTGAAATPFAQATENSSSDEESSSSDGKDEDPADVQMSSPPASSD